MHKRAKTINECNQSSLGSAIPKREKKSHCKIILNIMFICVSWITCTELQQILSKIRDWSIETPTLTVGFSQYGVPKG
ncbi:hypothetical protein PRUPE_2G182500 [Prunus persica]|uniref:Uncharacterized protein n=1 Tax=Prunus persica TaxID=3760 RepID=A0A251QHL0_PRUPE|nr:hypothetical protein PRUPE_2G182500 [Prunus persica]